MAKITDYSFLFQNMFGTQKTTLPSAFQLSQLKSSSVQQQLKAAGIDTNSRQYKAALKQMMSNANGAMYTNIQGIKNLMKNYDRNGDFMTKKEFLRENGVQNGDTTKWSDYLLNTGISMEISQRGLTLAGEMEPFLDTYETTRTLLEGTGHIGSETMMNGDFADVLAENYQNELQRIKENYSGKEYDRQLTILDKAYEEAAQSVSRSYVKQLKMLTGDLVIKPQTGISYSSEAEAEKAYQENLDKDAKHKLVIDSELSDTIQNDVKNILLQLKNSALNQQDKKNNIWGSFMSYTDIKKLGSSLKNVAYGNDDVSDFAKSILDRYTAVHTER